MNVTTSLRLGTRGSQLALYQARTVAGLIADAGGPRCDIVVIRTSGDQLQEAPLSEIGGKRLFVKEIEDALLRGEIDLAVHSSKDMPAVLPDGLRIAGVLPREDPHDAVVLPAGARRAGNLEDLLVALGHAPAIGTSSVRRIAQLTRLFPGARFAPVRGNLDTRLRKLDSGEHDALVLAAAGLRRLGLEDRIAFALPVSACVPAPGQGIIAIEMRTGDESVARAVSSVTDTAAATALDAERALVEALGGGCQTPIGALATPLRDDRLELVASVVALDGSRAVHTVVHGRRSEARTLGARAAEHLLADGAGEILEEARLARPQGDARTP
ncbi:MAG: hydroxymethylbilane synthase [Vicinamibacterales bacterium]